MHLFSLYLGKVTTPTPPTIAPLFSLRLLLRFSKLFLTPTSSNNFNLTIFFLITIVAFVRQDLQGIFFPILLMPGHRLVGTSENHSSSLLISLRHLTESDIRLCQPNFQLMALLLPSVNSFLAFYPIALYLLLLTAQPLHPSWSPVVFLVVLSFHLICFFSLLMIFFMPLPRMFTPLPMIQPYINLLPSSASLPILPCYVFNY